jgi:hypothetical protein
MSSFDDYFQNSYIEYTTSNTQYIRNNSYEYRTSPYNDIIKDKILKIEEENYSPPKGYKILDYGERIRSDDIYFNVCRIKWMSLDGYGENNIYQKGSLFIARKVKKKVDYSQEEKVYIINMLKSQKAFNGDSALKVEEKDFDICEYLSENNIIKCINPDRFYIEEKISP